MDNHPIPQDVTGFKFRIIGSITVKQFMYLLVSGVAVAILIFLISLNLIIKIPLVVILGGIGPFFAFIPIEGRPADLMLANFFRAVFANSVYLYEKQGANLALFPAFNFTTGATSAQKAKTQQQSKADVKHALLARTLRSSTYAPDAGETARIKNINSIFGDSSVPLGAPSASSIARPPMAVDGTLGTPLRQGFEGQAGVSESTKNSQKIITSQQSAIAPAPALVVESIGESGSSNKADMPETPTVAPSPQGSAIDIQHGIAPSDLQTTPTKSGSTTGKQATTPIESGQASNNPQPVAVVPDFGQLPDRPNVVLGVAQDARGKALGNIIVEVEDKDGTSVRTLKTSMDGKFSAATPLPDGEYKLKLEDPRGAHKFATINLQLAGAIFQPVYIKSVDAREELRKNLFENKLA